MTKSKKQNITDKQTWAVRVAVVVVALCMVILRANLDEANNKIFGLQVSSDYGQTLISILTTLSLLSLVILFIRRHSMTWQSLGRLGLIMLTAFLFTFGWKLTSIGFGGSWGLQNDGYSVTGGFMMFASGLYFGYLLKEQTMGKKK